MLCKMHAENPFCVIITGDFNCRSTQWWKNDIENNEGKLPGVPKNVYGFRRP